MTTRNLDDASAPLAKSMRGGRPRKRAIPPSSQPAIYKYGLHTAAAQAPAQFSLKQEESPYDGGDGGDGSAHEVASTTTAGRTKSITRRNAKSRRSELQEPDIIRRDSRSQQSARDDGDDTIPPTPIAMESAAVSSPMARVTTLLFVPLYALSYVLWCLWLLCYALFAVVFYYDVWLLVHTRALLRYSLGVREEAIRPLPLGRTLVVVAFLCSLIVALVRLPLFVVVNSPPLSDVSNVSQLNAQLHWSTELSSVRQHVSDTLQSLTQQLRSLEARHATDLSTLAQDVAKIKESVDRLIEATAEQQRYVAAYPMLTELHAVVTQLQENVTKAHAEVSDLIQHAVAEQIDTQLQRIQRDLRPILHDLISEQLTSDSLLTPHILQRLAQQVSSLISTASTVRANDIRSALQDPSILRILTSHVLEQLPSSSSSPPSSPSHVSSDSSSALCNVSLDDVQRLLRAHYRRLVADETLKVDWALEAAGAQVVESLTHYVPLTSLSSPLSVHNNQTTFLSLSWLRQIWRTLGGLVSRLRTRTHGPNQALRAGRALGECWPFLGGQANLTIRTVEPIVPTHFSIDHIPREIAINWQSAPRHMKVWGFNVPDGSRPSLTLPRTLLSSFEYDIDGDPLQTWPVQHSSVSSTGSPSSFQYFTLQILSNYGHFYTCLYRFRVHGQPARLYSLSPAAQSSP